MLNAFLQAFLGLGWDESDQAFGEQSTGLWQGLIGGFQSRPLVERLALESLLEV